ncbi:(deoxy)nucleoside triphosphate pyrophosphohydrolase [Acetivibrio clariflavus]|uniref:8-oxo-dGTP diphosphatase n=1 Tax=Acetivibrio clariflavus (strain DSM 19732 / NBRC 101661 / EBR45) TaxID=720554 RepID=G8LZR5_ACECE|nr:(deoxy)nucleoside triphosphate pyrophosphohydrolase [Acetivibrio clariflavus]AEV67966.1 ADP-ribose pyrophosphatase [Acetivibrio clariflavus DSM 19732]
MHEIEVVGAAIIEDNKVLAAQRSEIMKLPLKWEFAGGKVQKGETHEKALVRELREELGIEVSVGDFIAKGSSVIEDRLINLYVYSAKILKGVPQAREHARIMWIDIEDIMKLDWAEADLPACEQLLKKFV